MKEGIADTMAVAAKVYLRQGATGSVILPAHYLEDFHQFGEYYGADGGRFLYAPHLGGAPDYWYSTIGSLDEHDAGQPIGRAFYFLSQGASAHVNAHAFESFESYSEYLPWGMNGVEINQAARIFYHMFTDCLDQDDYNWAHACALYQAQNQTETDAVNDAFAGIGVGWRTHYPTPPPIADETTAAHDTLSTAQGLGFTNPPPGYEAVKKAGVSGTLSDTTHSDWYSVNVPCGATIGALVNSGVATNGKYKVGGLKVKLYSPSNNLVATSDGYGEIGFKTGTYCPVGTLYKLAVSTTGSVPADYVLKIDNY